jgi:hypothetical protein
LARFHSLTRLRICRSPGCRTRLLSHVMPGYVLSRCRRSSTIKYCTQSECALKPDRQRTGPSKMRARGTSTVSYRDHLHPIALRTANLVISLRSGLRSQVIKSSVLTVRMRALLSQPFAVNCCVKNRCVYHYPKHRAAFRCTFHRFMTFESSHSPNGLLAQSRATVLECTTVTAVRILHVQYFSSAKTYLIHFMRSLRCGLYTRTMTSLVCLERRTQKSGF